MKKKILVLDDDDAIAEAVQMMLELDGYEVVTSNEGDFVSRLNGDFPDVLLLDVWMSGHDGRLICQSLKADPKTKHIHVILLSATRDIKESAKKFGADDYLTKPFEMDELLGKVKKYATKSVENFCQHTAGAASSD